MGIRSSTWVARILAIMLLPLGVACGGGGSEGEDGSDSSETEAAEFNATGTAEVTFSGADSGTYELSFDVTEDTDPPPDYFNVQWKGDVARLFMNGESFTGTRDSGTYPNPNVLVASQEHLYISDGDECSVTFDVAEPSEVRGSFECSFVDEDVEATGTFAAKA